MRKTLLEQNYGDIPTKAKSFLLEQEWHTEDDLDELVDLMAIEHVRNTTNMQNLSDVLEYVRHDLDITTIWENI